MLVVLLVRQVLAGGPPTLVLNGHLLTDAQVQAYSNNTMTLLYSTKIPVDPSFAQAFPVDIFAYAEAANKEWAVSADASNIVFVVDGGWNSWSGTPYNGTWTFAFTNTSVLEVLYWLDNSPDIKLEYTVGKVTLRKSNVHELDTKALLERASNGDVKAQCWLGLCYYHGTGVAQDYTNAVIWYRKGAEQGNAFAQYWLGLCYCYGIGVPKDQVEASKWFRKSVERGNAAAQESLRKMLLAPDNGSSEAVRSTSQKATNRIPDIDGHCE